MTDDADEPVELRLARAKLAEAEQHHKAGDEAFAKAAYERGQIEHAKRLIEQTERLVAQRERKLKDLNEDALLARERAVAEREAAARERDALWDQAKYQALRELAG